MNDIAAAAGVSQSTVSRILNDVPVRIHVSRETRERVRTLAREMGYRPHPIARALRGAPTMQIGAVVRDITDPFFAGAVDALSTGAKARGYSVVLGHAAATADEALVLTAVLEARQCDAIVLLGDFRRERRLFEDLRDVQAPVVGLWHGAERRGRPFPTVSVDNRAGVYAALDHLTQLGHTQIAYVGEEALGDVEERRAAYTEYLAAAGLEVPSGFVQLVTNTIAGGELALTRLLAEPRAPTAVMAATDQIAIAIIHAAHERAVAVPEQLSVVGFDDIWLAPAIVPSLTTLKMPLAQIVAAGLDLAVGDAAWSRDSGEEPPRIVRQPQLIVRASTAAPTAAGSSERDWSQTRAAG
jgi:DNA-binding LacI/PurR family transcriptional regulator